MRKILLGLACGLLLGLEIARVAPAEAPRPDGRTLPPKAATASPAVRGRWPGLPRAVARAAPVTRRCADPGWLVLRAPLREERRGRETAYYLTGTLKNTCNTALVAQLELRGVTDGGALFALPAIEPVALMPGEERPLFRSLGQYPRGAMAALQVVVRCRDGAADLPPDRPPPLCGEPGG